MSSYIGLRRSAVLISLIFLLAGASSATSSWSPIQETSDDKITQSSLTSDPIMVDGLPPLMCGEELCEGH